MITSGNEEVVPGRLMHSPAIRYNDKVFAFYYKNEMVLRLGKDFNPKKFELGILKNFSPFKRKPPLKDWFYIKFEDKDKWEQLTNEALKHVKQRKR